MQMPVRSALNRVVVVVIVALIASCGNGSTETSSVDEVQRTEGELSVGEPIPSAGKSPVLEIYGNIGVTNDGDKLTFDMETLERMPVVEATLYEPFLEKDVSFEGVLLSDLLRYAEAESAAQVEMTALDDYTVTFSLEDLQADRTLLATRAQGSPIAIADGGPARIVFLDSETEYRPITDNWIWSVRSMELKGTR